MNDQERDRLSTLLKKFVPFDFIGTFYGVRLNQGTKLFDDFTGWYSKNAKRDAFNSDGVRRSAWESYLQAFSMLPMKWAGVQFGMSEESLREVLRRLPADSPGNHRVWADMVVGDLKRDLFELLPGMKHKLFHDHSELCTRLHQAILEAWKLPVEGLFCDTSIAMGEPIFAHDFDAVTMKPLSLPHQLWLNLGKPINLPPDRVSKLFYVQNRELLRPYLMTSKEPDGLGKYEGLMQGQPK